MLKKSPDSWAWLKLVSISVFCCTATVDGVDKALAGVSWAINGINQLVNGGKIQTAVSNML